VLREIEPLGTPTATHGICDAHAASVLKKGRAAMGMPEPAQDASRESLPTGERRDAQ
jgi:hypothetical protein